MAGALNAITGGKPKAVKMKAPEPQKTAPMPDEDDLNRQAAIKQAKATKGGRSSTILSDYESLG